MNNAGILSNPFPQELQLLEDRVLEIEKCLN
jgi:hypothetical protein